MVSWLSRVIERIHSRAREGNVRLTVKALTEARDLDLGVSDVIDALLALSPTGAIQSAGLVVKAALCFDRRHALQYR